MRSNIDVFILFLVFTEVILGGETVPTVYGMVNGSITFSPDIKSDFDEIVWKKSQERLVEYDGERITAYRQYRGRTDLNKVTGAFTLRNLTKDDRGTYVAEPQPNSILEFFKYNLIVIDPVSEPSVTCRKEDNITVLMCSAEGPVSEYRWEGHISTSWKDRPVELPVERGNFDKGYVCAAKNPVSEKRSQASCVKDSIEGSSSNGNIIGVLVPVLVVLLIVTTFVIC